jgi:hypothetical protein
MLLCEAEQRLRDGGLLARLARPDYLLVATGGVEAVPDKIQVYQNASALTASDNGPYTAIFPSAGMVTVNVSGTLDELVPIVERVYRHQRGSNRDLHESVREVVLGVPDWSHATRAMTNRTAADLPAAAG